MRNTRHARGLALADKQLLMELKEIILRFVPDAELFVYGSAARGQRGPESDYDVLILLNTSLSSEGQDAIGCAIYELELARGIVISEVFLSREEWAHGIIAASPFRQSVGKEAIRI